MGDVRVELVGKKFGRLQVVSFAGTSKSAARWNCTCECGTKRVVAGKYLRKGLTRSCGCLKREIVRTQSITHGMSKTKTYMSWNSMIMRCTNPNQESYKKYGAIGVSVCARWMESFAHFLEDMGERPTGKTLDRKNPFKGYAPDNCCWSTPKRQSVNQKRNLALEALNAVDPNWYEKILLGMKIVLVDK